MEFISATLGFHAQISREVISILCNLSTYARNKGRSRRLCVLSSWCCSVWQGIIIFSLKNSTIEKTRGIIRFHNALSFNETNRCSEIIGLFYEKTAPCPHATSPYTLQHKLDFTHKSLLLPLLQRRTHMRDTTTSDSPTSSLDVWLNNPKAMH